MSKLQDRVKAAAEEAVQNKKTICYIMSDTFECNTATKIQMQTMFIDMGVDCWFERLQGETIKIWLQWGLLSNINLGSGVPNKKPEGGGSIRG